MTNHINAASRHLRGLEDPQAKPAATRAALAQAHATIAIAEQLALANQIALIAARAGAGAAPDTRQALQDIGEALKGTQPQ